MEILEHVQSPHHAEQVLTKVLASKYKRQTSVMWACIIVLCLSFELFKSRSLASIFFNCLAHSLKQKTFSIMKPLSFP